jgi:hypothetical protein
MAAIGAMDVTRIARHVAEEKALPMKIIGAVVARGSDYVELLVNIITCSREPCAFSVGLFRNVSEEHLSQEIARRLERQFDQYQTR